MGRLIYAEGQLLGKNETKHAFVKELDKAKNGNRRARFSCGFCGTEFDRAISAVKSGRSYSCGCTQSPRAANFKGGEGRPALFDTPEKAETVYNQLLEHRKQGKSWDSFPHCSRITMQELALKFPDIFTQEKLHTLNAVTHDYYERIGMAMMLDRLTETVVDKETGKAKVFRRRGNSSIFMFMAKNILGWQSDPEKESAGELEEHGVVYEMPDGTVFNEDGSIADYD